MRIQEIILEAGARSLTVYRGVEGRFRPDLRAPITWVTTSREHAEMYTGGQGEVATFELTMPPAVLDLGFRSSETSVPFGEIRSRLKQAIVDQYSSGSLDRDQAMAIVDSLDQVDSGGHRQVYEWVHDPKILDIIRQAGYGAIRQNEGMSRHQGNVVTYGVLDPDRYLKRGVAEVISADQRCTNHALMSFGICETRPVIRALAAKGLLESAFDSANVRLHTFMNRDRPPTVAEFVAEQGTGHWLLSTANHAMALHDGQLVDTSKRGTRQRSRLLFAAQVTGHDQDIGRAFDAYRSQHPGTVFAG